MAKGIQTTKIPTPGKIHHTELQNGHVRFSFKHLDLNHTKFKISHRDGQYLHKLLDRLKSVSSISAKELRGNYSKAIRSHPITWQETTEPKGFSHLNEQLRGIDAYQFECERNEYGRVHGFYIEDIFFVCWLDADHKLYA
jgi:hypothetical protein